MITSIFIKRPRLSIVISIIITLSGLISYFAIPVSQFPEITPPTVAVTVNYPGADASSVEQAIAQIIEPAVNGVEQMIYMRSTSGSDGSYNLIITFEVGSNPDINAINVSNRVNRILARLPSEAQKLSVSVTKGYGSLLQVIAIFSPDGTRNSFDLSNFASLSVVDDIARVTGVASATLWGGQEYSMRIWLDVNRLGVLGLTTNDVIDSINSQNSQAAVGRIGAAPLVNTVDFQLNLTANSKLATVTEFEDIIIRADEKGGEIKVKDVAKVELGPKSEDSFARYNGKPAAGIGINLLPNANAIKTADGVRRVVEEINKRVPSGVKLEFIYDSSFFVNKMFSSVKETIFYAFILSALVVLLFLGSFRSSIIPIITIPVSLIGSFLIIFLLGYTLNTISLLALVLAIGIVVDDAIIVVENITHNSEIYPELSLEQVTKDSMRKITLPILAITLVLLSVFIPTIFIPGITGELYKQFSVVICASMLISALNALTLTPVLCVYFLDKHIKQYLYLKKIGQLFDEVKIIYLNIVAKISRQSTNSFIFIVFFGIMSFVLYKYVPEGFIPAEDQGVFMGELQLADAAAIRRTVSLLNNIEKSILMKPWAQSIFSVAGQSILENIKLPNKAFFVMLMKPYEERKDSSNSVKNAIIQTDANFQRLLNAQVIPFNLPAIPGLGQSDGFELQLQTLSGSSLDEFAAVARGFINAANNDTRLSKVFTNFTASTPQILLSIDRNKAKVLGINIKDVYDTLQANLAGTYINDFNYMGRSWQVKVEAEPSARMIIDDIFQIKLRSNQNEMISLKAIADVKLVTAPSIITRYNNLKSIPIIGGPSVGHSSGEAIIAIEEVAKKILPNNYKIQWTGSALQEKTAQNQKIIVFLLAILFSYLFLVALYESWLMPVAVILSSITGLFGAYLSMYFMGVVNNIYAQIGVIVLVALASKNAILIVDVAREKYKEGMSAYDAAIEAVQQRFRAIMMTSFAFILGVSPLILAQGPGAETQKSVSTAVFGGMLSSSLLGILFIPGLYIIFQNLSEKIENRLFRKFLNHIK